MEFIPHPYQERAIRRVIRQNRTGLFLDMGLGKTVITLTAVQELIYDRFEVARVLVVAPKRVAEDTWTREHKKWDHLKDLKVVTLTGTQKERMQGLLTDADVYVIGRDNVAWLVETLGNLFSSKFDMLVIDELSSFKNPQAKRFKALKTVVAGIPRIVGLTGTPSPNGLMDLWAEIYLLDQGERLGRFIGNYRNQYFYAAAQNGYVVYRWALRKGAEEEIRKRIKDICVSMRAEDYLQLPDRIDVEVPVVLEEKEKEIYRQFERDRLLELEAGTAVGVNAAAVMNKLLQMANGSVYVETGNEAGKPEVYSQVHTKKLEALEEIVEAAGEPVLVFYSFRHDLETIRKQFGDDAKQLEGPEDIAAWNQGKIRVLLAHPASVGYGLNLQDGGHIIVWYGLTWSLELYEQANARLHRQGQTRPVIIHHLIAEGTVDEQVLKALKAKDTSQQALLAALKERGGN